MKILVITTKTLIPNNNGYTIRMYNFLKTLKLKGINITLISFNTNHKNSNETQNEYKEICNKYIEISHNKYIGYLLCLKALYSNQPFKAEFYNSNYAHGVIQKELKNENYDYICGYHYLTKQFLDRYPNKKWIDLCDAISMLHEKNGKYSNNFFKKLFLQIEHKRVLNIEQYCIEKYNIVSLISEIDKKYLQKYVDTSKIQIVRNGIEFQNETSTDYNKNEICFLGDMAYIQNHQACVYFIKNILPELEKKDKNIVFKIIGQKPKQELYNLSKDKKNIIITGFVEDVKKELLSANIMVCPIKISAGLQNKVLEAMALGIPVIASPQVALPISKDITVLPQADTLDEWITNILEIMTNSEKRYEISYKSRQYVMNYFNWNTEVEKITCKFAVHLLENQLCECEKGEHN